MSFSSLNVPRRKYDVFLSFRGIDTRHPSTVRHQKGCYEDAFRRQEEKFKHDSFKTQSWRASLKKTANLSGFDSSKFENDADLVEQIVNCVWEKLKEIMPPNDSTELIGIHEQITELELLSCLRLHDVHIIGIWGMGGVGKTTIASLLFEKLSHKYDGYEFLENVKEELGKCGMTHLKNKLISKLLGGEELGITIPVGFLYPVIGLRNLEDKALISIVNKRVIMHNLIQEMGQQIVREESPNDLGKHRHLWNHDDIYEVLENNRGTADIESINLLRGSDRGIHLSPKVFEGMVNLKYLSFNNSSRLHISGNKLDSLPKKLKYFSWDFYPSKSLPSKLCLKNLVQLHLRNSNVRRLWNGTQDLGNLKKINLYGCEFLKELPDMSKASKLEQEFSVLSERTCIENVPSPVTLGLMNSLTILSLIGMKLVSLPASIKHLSNLEQLYLCHCSCLQSIPELPPSIKCLDARGCSSLKALFTSTSSWPGSHLINPPYPFVVILKGCYELGEDTMIDIVIYFMLLTIGAVYHQPTPGEPLPSEPLPGGTLPYYPLSLACIPLNKLPDVFNFQTRKGGYISIQVPLNSDLMAIVFCFAGCILEYRHFSLSCFVHVSNGETMKYFKYIDLWGNPGDHVVLWYNDHFNSRIMNGIKESRALSSPTDEYTKVSFQLDEVYTRGTNKEKVVGVYPIYASELQSCSTNIKRSWAQLLTHS
ncbi:hypothetical protein L6164_020966 [Bauhinia variegata]|uniref:Uncharacterized protein n=1 Tax=Bauhinia variegata TaxID=167791 RepID=A0ACB9MWV8_BAUVA|nr:hypothetical protein L6164_020966 [Bauhinia variegata]